MADTNRSYAAERREFAGGTRRGGAPDVANVGGMAPWNGGQPERMATKRRGADREVVGYTDGSRMDGSAAGAWAEGGIYLG